jgi:murein DD-endopeptidase MepM/ murein hydrolase activator NlpD
VARHRSSASPRGGSTNARLFRTVSKAASVPVEAADATDIVPSEKTAPDRESQVTHPLEVDDTADTDAGEGVAETDVIALGARLGAHRKDDGIPLKGRLMVAAMAVGAIAAGAYSMSNASDEPVTEAVLAAEQSVTGGGAITGSRGGMQIVAVTPAYSSPVHAEEIIKAVAFAQERAEREARLQRPMFAMPTRGAWTSGFGNRWGVLHGGIDIANSIGTPILAASDGVVIDAGPTAGYGVWVKLRHSDGTVTLYGHLSAVLVNIGERVYAGDQIAKMGNTGYSTGPHLHFEVLLNGTDRVDPVGWLSKRGLSLGN